MTFLPQSVTSSRFIKELYIAATLKIKKIFIGLIFPFNEKFYQSSFWNENNKWYLQDNRNY